jgi:O-antigen/teichoic acid export membrane protein
MSKSWLSKPQAYTLGIAGTRAVAAIAIQKAVAMGFGPTGVLLLGQMLLVQGLCYGLLTDGINRAAMVEAGRAPTQAARASILVHGAQAGGLLMGVVVAVLWGTLPLVLPDLAAHGLPLAVALGAGGLYWWAGPILQFEKKPFAYWSITFVVGAGAVLAATLPASWLPNWGGPEQDSLTQRLFFIAAVQGVASAAVAVPYYLRLRADAQGAPALSLWGLLRRMGAYGGFSLAVLLAGRGADVVVRAMAMTHLDMDALGMWQASVRLGDLLLAPFVPLFGSLFFAQAAQMSASALPAALHHQLRAAALGLVAIAATVVVGPWLLGLLNRADFAAGIPYYRWQAPGDMLRLIAFPISIALMAQGRLRQLAWLEGFSLASYLLLAYGGAAAFGTLGLAMAHTVRYALFAGATVWVAKDVLWPNRLLSDQKPNPS